MHLTQKSYFPPSGTCIGLMESAFGERVKTVFAMLTKTRKVVMMSAMRPED
jgi:hypothetical protein